jgi:hypothetical protein
MAILEIPLTSASKSFWERVHTYKTKYPFWCTTGSEPRPEFIPPRVGDRSTPYGHFCRIVYDNTVFWGFDTDEGRGKFVTTFGAEYWKDF